MRENNFKIFYSFPAFRFLVNQSGSTRKGKGPKTHILEVTKLTPNPISEQINFITQENNASKAVFQVYRQAETIIETSSVPTVFYKLLYMKDIQFIVKGQRK